MTTTQRRRGVFRAAVAAAAMVGGVAASVAATAAFAAAPSSYGASGPDGLTVDVGSCFSSVQCATMMGGLSSQFEPIDLTTLPDWDSALDGDYTPYITAGANGSLIVIRNDSAADITLKDMPSNATLLNHNTGETLAWSGEGAWSDTTLKPGEFIVLRPNTTAFGNLVADDPADYDVPTDYTWFLKTDKGDVEATWSGTPTGSWNTAIVDAAITPDDAACAAGDVTGNLTFTVSYTPSEQAVEWAKTIREFIASPEYNGQEPVMWSIGAGLAGSIQLVPDSPDFAPSAAGWKTDGVAEELFTHVTSITKSHPGWMNAADPSYFPANSIVLDLVTPDVSAPWPDDGVAPETTLTISDLPVTWTNPATDRPIEFNLTGESLDIFSGASFASTQGAVITNPCAVVVTPEPTPTPTPTPEPTTEPTPTPEPTVEPTPEPTPEPTVEPTPEPTVEPTVEPTTEPTPTPTTEPTTEPTVEPTTEPTVEPTTEPTVEPTTEPTVEPTVTPEPTGEPTKEPTAEPTKKPEPTKEPVVIPSATQSVPAAVVPPVQPAKPDRLATTGSDGTAPLIAGGTALMVLLGAASWRILSAKRREDVTGE